MPENEDGQKLIEMAKAMGADHAALILTERIPFVPSLRESCNQNYCGRFDTCWVGPPAIGTVDSLIGQVRAHRRALVVQTVGQLEDSFDYEGMMAAKTTHTEVFRTLLPELRKLFADGSLLALSCGCCDLCPTCTYPDEPCRNPEHAVSAVEAYGINVNPMLTACGLKYNNGANTVSYVSLFILPEPADQ